MKLQLQALILFVGSFIFINASVALTEQEQNCIDGKSNDWALQEVWVWEQLCQGERADFNRKYELTDSYYKSETRPVAGFFV